MRWECAILLSSAEDAAEVELEQLDEGGHEWYASGPGGDHLGPLAEVVRLGAGDQADPQWLEHVEAAIRADRRGGRRSALVVGRVSGTWFHTTFAVNRASIRRHGLDWRHFNESGIAGSRAPEAEGIFLSSDRWSAEWFAQMGANRGRGEIDIWRVELNDQWLLSDPGSGGGRDLEWAICPVPIPPGAVSLDTAPQVGG